MNWVLLKIIEFDQIINLDYKLMLLIGYELPGTWYY